MKFKDIFIVEKIEVKKTFKSLKKEFEEDCGDNIQTDPDIYFNIKGDEEDYRISFGEEDMKCKKAIKLLDKIIKDEVIPYGYDEDDNKISNIKFNDITYIF